MWPTFSLPPPPPAKKGRKGLDVWKLILNSNNLNHPLKPGQENVVVITQAWLTCLHRSIGCQRKWDVINLLNTNLICCCCCSYVAKSSVLPCRIQDLDVNPKRNVYLACCSQKHCQTCFFCISVRLRFENKSDSAVELLVLCLFVTFGCTWKQVWEERGQVMPVIDLFSCMLCSHYRAPSPVIILTYQVITYKNVCSNT